MPHVASSTTSLALARERADRDRRAADDWRRLHAAHDLARDPGVTASQRSLRPIVARLVAGLGIARARLAP